MMYYADFVTRLKDTAVYDGTEQEFIDMLPAIINAAELRCYREIDFVVTRKLDTTTVVPSSGSATYALPADLVVMRNVTTMLSNVRTHLQRRDNSFLDEYWPNRNSVGTPKYWSMISANTILLSPTPGPGAYSVELEYTYRPTPLSATNTSTWLTTWCEDLFFCAAMVFMCGFQRNYGSQADDPKMAMSWETQYQTAKIQVATEERRRKADGFFDASMTPPPSSAAPTG